MKYVVKKAIEECGELITALVKHDLHSTNGTKDRLEEEIADTLAMLTLLGPVLKLDAGRTNRLMGQRLGREVARK